MPLLEVENLDVSYGEHRAVQGVSFAVEEGEIFAIIGANGAGKSTILRALSGLLSGAKGSIRLAGEEILKLDSRDIVERHLIHCPEGRQVFGRLTVEENLIVGSPRKSKASERKTDMAKIFAIFPRLLERRRQLARSLSGGEQQMLAIGRAMMAKPRLLLLDEPSLGLAPNIVTALFGVIRDLNRDGTTILLVEQNARKALAAAHKACVLEVGRIILAGTGKELLADPAVRDAYLGGVSAC